MSGRSKVVSDKTEFLNFQPDKCPMSGAILRLDDENNRSPLRAQEGTFYLTLLGLCSPLVKKCFGCKQLLKFKSGSKLLIPV